MVRSNTQKTTQKRERDENSDPTDHTADIVILKPQGYPLTSMLDEYPEIENVEVFEHYARIQWNGYVAHEGDYLFDRRMYPDFAYKIIEVMPPNSAIGMNTTIIISDEEKVSTIPELKTDVSFDDVIGQSSAKQKCKLIERFLKEPDKFGKWAPRNVLFFGPSGTGKTMLAKALANKTNVPLLPIKATQLIGEFVGEGARQIHQLYDRAEEMQPCIIFIDELDAIALDRKYQELRGDVSEIVNALLTEMDGIVERQGVCTIGATNRTTSLDPAVRSRFEEEIEFALPDENDRAEMIKMNLDTFPIPVEEIDIARIAKLTDGLSGRDIVEKLLKTALHNAIMNDEEVVKQDHFESVMAKLNKERNTGALDRLYI